MLVWRAILLLPALTVALRLGSFRRSYSALSFLLRWLPRWPRSYSDSLPHAQRTAQLVAWANRNGSPIYADCLPRSLVLWYLLRRRGLPAEIRLGARTLTGRFEAHAWVEYHGIPLDEKDDVKAIYTAFLEDRSPDQALRP